MFLRRFEPRTGRTTAEVINFVMWPLAVMTVIHRIVVKAVNGSITDDYAPVYNAALAFLNRQDVYTANFNSVDPHYLYPPSGTMLLAPIAILDPEKSRWLFILANAIAVIIALFVLLKMFDLAWSSIAAPILIFAAFSTETVSNTLIFSNINGLILLAEVAFLALLLRRRDLWAGTAIGLTFAIKPILAPLLLLPLVRGQWKVFVTAVGIPLVLMAVAWPLAADPMAFIEHTFPYLMESRDYFNSAIVGNGTYFGLPVAMIWALRIAFAAMGAVSLWLLYRYYRHDELFFVTTTAGLLMVGSFLLLSLGQMYYSMLLFPLLMTVVLRNSVMRNWPAWLAAYGFLSADAWFSSRFVEEGRAVEYLKPTYGWSLLLIVIFCVLVNRYLTAKREGRLDKGIDPDFLVETDGRADSTVSAKV
ncbi:alpha-(1-_3)-arabinofuranosyltransferase [Prescottella equi]|uniref:glycosyltransferase family 87 protein n=1 Tax=Rhodococcus hoagii TaxID=43767 RepID=UPI001C7450D8|nr:glycosyltransferase family 87 protein [Prescottella equi]BCN63667.1 alpha-(1->3)-arabinofuranosyltransferase [Prescottella equi]BCN73516.1 alpha-(1->3)-arabinofuranosyltransferase [Prescottella equi]